MSKIPMLEKFAAQSLVEHDGELIFSKEKFAELIVRECIKESMEEIVDEDDIPEITDPCAREYLKGNNQGIVDAVIRFRNHFGVRE